MACLTAPFLIARNQTHPASLKVKHLFGVCEVYTSGKLFRFLSSCKGHPPEGDARWVPKTTTQASLLPSDAVTSRQVSHSRASALRSTQLLLLFTVLLLLLKGRSKRHRISQDFTSTFTSLFLLLMSDYTRPGGVFSFLHSLFFPSSFFDVARLTAAGWSHHLIHSAGSWLAVTSC